ncbi:ABC transporter ATP-binding protein [Companilactobacillus alimentarius]|uniref:Putative hemin import ATP-binding protein HrtA n=1 Tax=Companilactobacillus alimentarius DSM 20249 TaxID=1423720 RepID=A0A2K9HRI8_9LACO|nr:ABC transporter ATP-binding protein [Companilactobacillus alimentarius]AUI72532.1 hemin ABC transporter ATP-binding protein [Companilactobacillus alimentarius DSM 20249]KRK77698.1 ABC-type antimicrobial peptide transport system, ATPase component [Companilactobacillus alimentarius DSM 20249]MDT6953127.1 ABC transporter ATP-binding protein [Companilactobacillus alimentarius]GEO45065.1 peptide ABC transporter ATP-binding protein [Companilactobacillus alimentarius]
MSLLEVKDVVKQYGSGHTLVEALHETNFTLNKGEFSAIIGPSGSGKTTLLTILGLLQTPTSGEIWIDGSNVTELNSKEKTDLRFNKFGFILQASNLIPFLTVREQFKLVDKFTHKSKKKMSPDELLEMLDLQEVANNYPSNLSGGERQRAAIARSLYNNPDIILADEPTASLDTKRAEQVVELLAKIAHKSDQGVIMITHDTRLLKATDRVFVMRDGTLEEDK